MNMRRSELDPKHKPDRPPRVLSLATIGLILASVLIIIIIELVIQAFR
jgi:hypothetical protein